MGTMAADEGPAAPRKEAHPLRWQGDFTVPRVRALLGNNRNYQLVDGDYTQNFFWDRGGKIPFAYRTAETDPKPSTYTVESWREGADNYLVGKPGEVPSTKAARLPKLPPVGLIKKKVSVVERKTPFTGYFCEKEIICAPEKQVGGKRAAAAQQKSSLPESPTEKQIVATRALWRQASTGDVYFKEGGTDVPGISAALKDGAILDHRSPQHNGMTLFSFTCHQNDKELAKYLFGLGADFRVIDNSKRNVFHHCAKQNGADVLVWLLRTLDPKDISALILAKDENGNTPLHFAAERGSLVVCNLFITFKSTDLITITNKEEKIPYDVALLYRQHHLLKLLNPLEYVKDQTSLIARIRNKLGAETEVLADGGGGDEEEEEDEEGGGGGASSGPLGNLTAFDRYCNQKRKQDIDAATKGAKKGGKKGKKKKK
eukprot:g14774.t1